MGSSYSTKAKELFKSLRLAKNGSNEVKSVQFLKLGNDKGEF
jgi:hypothetical protein